jgi:alpha-galactosidase
MNRNKATEKAANVQLAVEENKNVSLRQIGKYFGIHLTTAQNFLKNQRPQFQFQIC